MRKQLFELAARLTKSHEDSEAVGKIADVLNDVAETGEYWEVEKCLSLFK